jgi:hypothetical protein
VNQHENSRAASTEHNVFDEDPAGPQRETPVKQNLMFIALLLSSCGANATEPRALAQVTALPPWLRALHAQAVEVDVGEGEQLRGVFIPPQWGEPLYLHFLGAPLAGTAPSFDTQRLLREFTRCGAGSLVLDMRGVGNSAGTLDPRHVPADALAAGQEALRRTGDAQAILVRGIEHGNLSALALLEQGIRPGQVLLIAPLGELETQATWQRAFGSVDGPLPSEPWPLGLELAHTLELTGRVYRSFVLLAAQDESSDTEQTTALLALKQRRQAIVLQSELQRSELGLAAAAPFDIELDVFLPRAPARPGFCALRTPDQDIVHPVPNFVGSEIYIGDSIRR